MRVNNIKSGNYEGYLWLSNAQKTEIIYGEFDKDLNPNNNPFIIEAQLYDKKQMLSYSIKYVDEQYIINEYEVKSTDFNSNDIEIMDFYSNRIKEHKMLQFLQYWRDEEDENCEDMEVLQPKELVFVGFNDKEE